MSQLEDCDIRGEWLNGRREKRACGVGLGERMVMVSLNDKP